jgi:hypothetical protein
MLQDKTTYKVLRQPRFFMESYLKIRALNKRIIPLQMNEPQILAHNLTRQLRKRYGYVRIRNLKARKLGMSTYWDGRIFHNTVTIPNTSSAIISHDSESSRALLDICKLFYEELPAEIRPMRRYYSKKSLVFENPNDEARITNPGLRSSITITPAKSAKFGRAPVFHNVHLSEIAHYPSTAEELLTGILSAVPDNRNTFIIEETTANGAQGLFFDRWNKSDEFYKLFLPWFILSRYKIPGIRLKKAELDSQEIELVKRFHLSGEQLEWRRRIIKNKCNGKLEIFKQEYPSTPKEAFIYSGSNVFSGPVLEYYNEHFVHKPIALRELAYASRGRDESSLISKCIKPHLKQSDDPKSLISFYKLPIPHEEYFIGADPSEGLTTSDEASAIVLDSHGEEVAMFSERLDPISFTFLLAKLGLYYNTATIIPEANNHGGTVIAKLLELNYPSLYRRESLDSVKRSVSKRVGWFNNGVTKGIAISFLSSALDEFVLSLHSQKLISQLENYVKKPNGELFGDNDDLVIALALATYAAKDSLSPIFERKRIHNVLNINEEQAEKIQQVAKGTYHYPMGSYGYMDQALSKVYSDDEIDDFQENPHISEFDERFLIHYYQNYDTFPSSLMEYPVHGL